MIPYLGCKQSFAGELLAQMPEAEHFYDLFGGGGSVVEAAAKCKHSGFLGEWQKWKHIHYNELNKGVYEIVTALWAGKFDFAYAKAQKPTKERYYAERGQNNAWGAFVSFVWSFGNKNESFIYPVETSSIRRNEHIQRINRIAKTPLLKEVITTNKDYREVHIEPSSVVYCDIPYSKHRKYYNVRFDFNAFYEWALAVPFPVYFSGYGIVEENFRGGKFKLVHQIPIKPKINRNRVVERTEKLFWNGVKVC